MATLSVNKRVYAPNERITVTYDMRNTQYTSGSCWIGLIESHVHSTDEYENDRYDHSYFYVRDNRRGNGALQTSTIGTYVIRCFANDNRGQYLGMVNHTIEINNDAEQMRQRELEELRRKQELEEKLRKQEEFEESQKKKRLDELNKRQEAYEQRKNKIDAEIERSIQTTNQAFDALNNLSFSSDSSDSSDSDSTESDSDSSDSDSTETGSDSSDSFSDDSDGDDTDSDDDSDTDLDDEKDDETEGIPPEIHALQLSTTQGLKDICEAQSKLKSTADLLARIETLRPNDADMTEEAKELWDIIDGSIKTTTADIKLVNNMKNDYLSNIINVADLMNETDDIDNANDLENKLDQLQRNQREYKRQLRESTQNTLKILKDVLSKVDDPHLVDTTINEMDKNLQHFDKAQEELSNLKQEKVKQTTAMKENISTFKIEIRKIKVKKTKNLRGQEQIRKQMRENRTSSHSYTTAATGGISSGYSYSGGYNRGGYSHFIQIPYSRSNLDQDLKILESEYVQLNTKETIKKENLKATETKLTHFIAEHDNKIKKKETEFNEYKQRYEKATETLDSMVQKTGVDQKNVKQFLTYTKQIVPTMIADQESTNKLTMDITTNYDITKRHLDRIKRIKYYKIREYMEDTDQFINEYDLYVNILNQSGYITVKELTEKTGSKEAYEKKIFPLFAYRPSFCNGTHGIYNYASLTECKYKSIGYRNNVSRAIKRKFRQLCLDKNKLDDAFKKYKIRQYLEDTDQFINEYDSYINVLNQSGYVYMKQLLGKKKKYKKKIFPLFEYRPSFCNGSYGTYNYAKAEFKPKIPRIGYVNNVPKAIKKKFRELCLDKKWKKFQKKANALRQKQRKSTQKYFGKMADTLKGVLIKSGGNNRENKKQLLVESFKNNAIMCVDDEKTEIKIITHNEKRKEKLKKYMKKAAKRKTIVTLNVSECVMGKDNVTYKILDICLKYEKEAKIDVKALKSRTLLCVKIINNTDMIHCLDEEFNKIKFKFESKDKKFKKKIKKIVRNGTKQKKDVKLMVTEIVQKGKKNSFRVKNAVIDK